MNEAKGPIIKYGLWQVTTGLFDAIDSNPDAAIEMVFGIGYEGDKSLHAFLQEFKNLYLKSGLDPQRCVLSCPANQSRFLFCTGVMDVHERFYFNGALAGNTTPLPFKLTRYQVTPAFIHALSNPLFPNRRAMRAAIAHEIGHELRGDVQAIVADKTAENAARLLDMQDPDEYAAAIRTTLRQRAAARRSRHIEWQTDLAALALIGDVDEWYGGTKDVLMTAYRMGGRLRYSQRKSIISQTHPSALCRIRLAGRVHRHIKSLES
jgi:hypothetical protein